MAVHGGRARRFALITGVALCAGALVPLASAPANASPGGSIADIWPGTGAYVDRPVLGLESARYNNDSEPIDLGGGNPIAPGGLLGYEVYTVWPSVDGGRPDCAPASGGDSPTNEWSFVDAGGSLIADAQGWGFGESGFAEHYGVLIRADESLSTDIAGFLQLECVHTDGTPTARFMRAPLEIAPDAETPFASATQWSVNKFSNGRVASLDAVGFAPGESVTVSLVDANDDTPAVLDQAAVIADGAGGVTAQLPVPSTWGSAGSAIDVFAVGATSRYAFWLYLTPEDLTGGDAALNAFTAANSDSPSGRAALIGLYGYDAGATVKVYVHSAAGAVELGTATVGSNGSASATLALPTGVPSGARIWAGEKTGGYRLLSTPLQSLVFTDVPGNYVFHNQIMWMADRGISLGYDVFAGREYRPLGAVTRDQMAAFLYRYAGSPAYTPPQVSPFVDVPTNYVFYKQIAWLASEGVSTGWDVGGGKKEYRPFVPVSRDVMAAFLYRSAGSPAYSAPSTSPFVDVPKGYVFYKEIAWLGSEGISTGWDMGGGKKEYRPFTSVLRDQMAAFLQRSDARVLQ